jgi:hypothetical protein
VREEMIVAAKPMINTPGWSMAGLEVSTMRQCLLHLFFSLKILRTKASI